METMQAVKTIDLKGLLCPIPVVKMAQAIKTVAVGEVIEAVATDPGVMADMPAWCRTTGHELLRIGREDKLITLAVKRAK